MQPYDELVRPQVKRNEPCRWWWWVQVGQSSQDERVSGAIWNATIGGGSTGYAIDWCLGDSWTDFWIDSWTASSIDFSADFLVGFSIGFGIDFSIDFSNDFSSVGFGNACAEGMQTVHAAALAQATIG